MSLLNETKIYMCGDSHSVEFYGFIKEKIEIKFQTLGGYGLCSFFDPDSQRPANDTFKDQFHKFFQTVEKDSVLLISASDVDSRIGLGDRFKESRKLIGNNFFNYYKLAFESILESCSPRKIILLDLYPLVPNGSEQNVSDEKRLMARDIFVNLIPSLQFDNIHLLTVHKDGVTHDVKTGKLLNLSTARDKAHFNLQFKFENGKLLGDHLFDEVVKIL